MDVLALLREQKLEAYDGSVALSTWVTLITRRKCVDDLRSRFGRRVVPKWLDRLDELDQMLYRMHFIDGLGYPEIIGQLRGDHPELDAAELARRFDHILSSISQSAQKRLAYDLVARRSGMVSGRLIEFIEMLRSDASSRQSSQEPDAVLDLDDAQIRLAGLRKALARLSEADRDILDRYYWRRQTAKEIASDLGLAGPRRSYSLVDRAVRRLRKSFGASGVME